MKIEMESDLSFRILLAIVYVGGFVFLSLCIRGCFDYNIKSEKQYIDGGFTRKTLPGSDYVSWVREAK